MSEKLTEKQIRKREANKKQREKLKQEKEEKEVKEVKKEKSKKEVTFVEDEIIELPIQENDNTNIKTDFIADEDLQTLIQDRAFEMLQAYQQEQKVQPELKQDENTPPTDNSFFFQMMKTLSMQTMNVLITTLVPIGIAVTIQQLSNSSNRSITHTPTNINNNIPSSSQNQNKRENVYTTPSGTLF